MDELIVDYGKPVAEIYTDVAIKLLKISQNLISLSQVQPSGPRQPGLPSWVPD